mgnify:CR=1 FL=1
MEKYEIHIGKVLDFDTNLYKPKLIIEISPEQKLIIETFASTRKDQDLHTIYEINGIDFKIYPVWNINRPINTTA